MSVIDFTANQEDLSTNRGYQFKFYCDRCGNGYLSRFQPSGRRTTGGLLRAAGGIFGGRLAGTGNVHQARGSGGGDEERLVQQTVSRLVRDRAYECASERAVAEAKGYFKHCSRCAKWVCSEVCWNARAALCEECGPRGVEN
jgi:hypothetical protein